MSHKREECISAFSAVTTIRGRPTKLVFPAVRHRRVQSPTCSRKSSTPHQNAPTYHILTLCCAFYPHSPPLYSPIAVLLTATSSLFRLLFTVKWSPSQSHSSAGLLFISLVFFVPPLSVWLGAYLRVSAAGWLSTENPRPQQNKTQANIATFCHGVIYVNNRRFRCLL